MADLVIKGHTTRGKEIIELLEMLGANRLGYKDTFAGFYYYIECGAICSSDECPAYSTILTLEEFEEKYPHKVGDKVISNNTKNDVSTVVSMKWDTCLCTIIYYTESTKGLHNRCYFAYELKPYKEKPMDRKYNVEEYLKVWAETEKGLEVVVNDKFEIKEDNGKFYIIKKKTQYPKTYVECAKMLNCFGAAHIDGYKGELLDKFQELLICRDAYWKIAGEEMGLGKPWEPDWNDDNHEIPKYCIYRIDRIISKDRFYQYQFILSFPTPEMRDIFCENFKDLIEKCKELL